MSFTHVQRQAGEGMGGIGMKEGAFITTYLSYFINILNGAYFLVGVLYGNQYCLIGYSVF